MCFFISARVVLMTIFTFSFVSWLAYILELSPSTRSFMASGDVGHLGRPELFAGSDQPEVSNKEVVYAKGGSQCQKGALGMFAKIFVVSLPHRTDRRKDMENLRSALSLNWLFLDAVPSNAPAIGSILEHVKQIRQQLTPTSDLLGIPRPPPHFQWPSQIEQDLPGLHGSDFWVAPYSYTADQNNSNLPPSVFPAYPPADDDALQLLTCAAQNHVLGPSFSPSLPAFMHLTPAKVACWHSHLQAIRRIAFGLPENSYLPSGCGSGGSGLVLEDDVDIESDIDERLQILWKALPPQWDIVFLGHCWSNESHFPALATTSLVSSQVQTSLHPSFAPKCTHAYALSQAGARKLLNHLRFPPFAYSRALDQALSWLVLSGRLTGFSVVPSIAVQRKISPSDVDNGKEGLGSEWRDYLAHGVLSQLDDM